MSVDLFIQLAKINGRSGQEAGIAAKIRQTLIEAGLNPAQIAEDDANQKSYIGGDSGNLIVTLPGDESQDRVLLSAHMDTVPVCLNADPVVKTDPFLGEVVESASDTGLGADDRAGCAVLLTAALKRLEHQQRSPHAKLPPAVLLFLIQEEIGLVGARHLNRDLVGKVDQAFNFDGGTMDKIRHGAIGGERMQATVNGLAAHAGVAPQSGVSAIVIAAKAIADLDSRGLLGRIEIDGRKGTANVGVIAGGEATNVITPELTMRMEARSHDAEFRSWIVSQIQESLESVAKKVRNDAGHYGRIEFSSHIDYEAFQLPESHPSIMAARQQLNRLGIDAVCEVANGGLDANWLYQHGIEAVTLGCGQANIHTTSEQLLVSHFLSACELATNVLLGDN